MSKFEDGVYRLEIFMEMKDGEQVDLAVSPIHETPFKTVPIINNPKPLSWHVEWGEIERPDDE